MMSYWSHNLNLRCKKSCCII